VIFGIGNINRYGAIKDTSVAIRGILEATNIMQDVSFDTSSYKPKTALNETIILTTLTSIRHT